MRDGWQPPFGGLGAVLTVSSQIQGNALMLVSGVLSAVAAVVLMAIHWRVPGHRGLAAWSLSFAGFCLAFTILLALPGIWSLASALILGSQLIGLGAVLGYLGVWQFLQLPRRAMAPLIPAIIIMFAQAWLLAFPDAGMRELIITASLPPMILSGAAAWFLFARAGKELWPAHLFAATFHLQWSAALGARVAWWIVAGRSEAEFDPTMAAALLSHIIFVFGASPAYLWMVRRRMDAKARGPDLRDVLTGVANRHAMWEQGARLHAAAVRDGRAGSLLIISIDHLGRANERFGRGTGDAVLMAVSRVLAEQLRDRDVIARVGGGEFMAMLPDVGCEDSLNLADRLRLAVTRLDLPLESGDRLRCTVSIGLCPFEGHSRSWEGLVLEAEKALFCAKQLGRNCVEIAPPTEMAAA